MDRVLFVKTTLIFGFIIIPFRYSYSQKVKEFQDYVDTIGLSFVMPNGFEITSVIDNGDLWYSFAIKHTSEPFEVRYSDWSLKPKLIDYEECLNDPQCMMVHPNKLFKGIVEANVLNVTGGQMWVIGPFSTDAVKNEFNADAGGSSFFEFNSEFGKGYKYGQLVYLHKDDIADVIITFMSNDKSKHSDLMYPAFLSLTFK